MPHNVVLARVRAEYLEMPGLRLTLSQAERLCGIEPVLCQWVLERLVDVNFLCRNSNGVYARVTDGMESLSTRQEYHAQLPQQTPMRR